MKNFCHRIRINVSDKAVNKEQVMDGVRLRVPAKILRLIFGELTDVMVIAPGRNVDGIEIHEVRRNGRYEEEV